MFVVRAVVAVLVGAALGMACAENIELRSGKQVEFFDDLQKGDSWGVQFQIVEGSIGFRLSSPEGVIYEGPMETYGSYALTAKTHGMHSFKFINSDAHGAVPRKISFSILGSSVSEGAKKLDPVQNELRELNAGLRIVRDEHSFLMDREVKHRQVASSTNSRVMWWFFSQIALLSAVCYFQISSLKRFFEVRRLV